jgi:NAD(P)-dependent dehydrogenase (short-subunit alcohol dehydrogenase family)
MPSAPITIVTGSSRGIGLQIAEALGRAGHRLVLTARDATALQQAQTRLEGQGIECTTVAADLLDPDASGLVLAHAQQSFGEADVLVNNAGTAPTAKAEATTDEMLHETLGLHVVAPMRLIRAVLPAMKARGKGCIVQLASTAGLRGYPFTTAYTAAKHGMVGVARALRSEVASRGIDVYALCPGFVDTDITRGAAADIAARGKTSAQQALDAMAAQNRIGRLHSCEEVAAAVVDLVTRRPDGCTFELDRQPPAFLD